MVEEKSGQRNEVKQKIKSKALLSHILYCLPGAAAAAAAACLGKKERIHVASALPTGSGAMRM